MSRQIDMTKPLSDEDREYLETRARQDLIAQNDEQFGVESDEEGSPGNSLQAEKANLQITGEVVIEDDYSSMTNDELRDELEDRGLATSGAKADLQDRLREDDAKQDEE